ncbi:MAG: hypothetical protein K2K24_01340, partial [Clostridia bacterium]|nr:hypothetical protein [Clostridia bacterium]
YGDRVIELADGKIISDITKETAESRKESEGLSVVDDKILHIRKGYKLTKADMAKIQQYLDNADSDTIISLDERSNESFCQIARIDKDGNQEVFRDTNNEMLSEENKKYDGTSKFIRSKLPFSHAFKIGSSSLKTKPFRLFMTIFLCLISFAMFGLADTIGSYNAKKTTVNSIIDSQYDSAVFTVHQNNDGNYFYDSSGASAKDLDRIKEKTGMDFMGVAYTNSSFSVYESTKLDSGYQYYISQIKGYLPAGNDNFQKYGFDELIGRQPIASDEIVITKYTYEHFALGGLTYYDENEREQVTIKKSEFDSPEKFLSLNPTLALNDYSNGTNKYWKIVGIVDTKTNADGRFDALKPKDNDNSSSSNADSIGSFLLTSEYRKYINYGYHSLGYISENAFKEVVEGQISSTISSVGTKAKGSLSFSISNNYRSISFNAIAKSEDLSKFEVMWFGGAKDTLADDEFVISLDSARDYRLFDYNDGEKVEESEIVIDFNKQYFGGIVRANITQLSDLSINSMRNAIVAFCEAADALTDEQAEEFRAYVKGIGEKSNTNIMDRYIQDMIYEARNCT